MHTSIHTVSSRYLLHIVIVRLFHCMNEYYQIFKTRNKCDLIKAWTVSTTENCITEQQENAYCQIHWTITWSCLCSLNKTVTKMNTQCQRLTQLSDLHIYKCV